MKRKRALFTVVSGLLLGAIVILLSWGCGSARRGVPLTEPVPLTPVVQRGQVVFMQHCHMCHPGGAAGLGPALNDKPLPRGLIRFQVRNGLGAMPSFDKDHISDDHLDDLVEYAVTLRKLD
jgi:mono/diheme cytochrome c family protein